MDRSFVLCYFTDLKKLKAHHFTCDHALVALCTTLSDINFAGLTTARFNFFLYLAYITIATIYLFIYLFILGISFINGTHHDSEILC